MTHLPAHPSKSPDGNIRYLALIVFGILGLEVAIVEIDGVVYELLYNEVRELVDARTWPCLLGPILTLVFFAVAHRVGNVSIREIALASIPLCVLSLFIFPLVLVRPGFVNLYFAMFCVGLTTALVMRRWRGDVAIPPHLCTAAAVVVTGAAIVWTASFQTAMYERFLLGYGDIGLYFSKIRNTIEHGAFHRFRSDIPAFYYHFCPALIALVPLVALWPHLSVLIWVQSVVICGLGVLIYILAVKRGMSRPLAVGVCVAYLLYPATSQLTYSFSYGFHPPTLAMPLLLLSFYWLDQGRWTLAIVPTIGALLVQEHFATFYIFMGCVWALTGRWRRGVVCIIGGAVYFLVAVKAFMNSSAGVRLWDHLGDSMVAIAMSPLTRPDVFWPLIARPGSIHLLVQLFLPMAFAAVLAPRFVLAMVPVFMFNFMREGEQSVSIVFHYQTGIISVLFLAVVMGLTRKDDDPVLPGVAAILGRIRRWVPACAVVAAAVAISFIASFHLSLLPWARFENNAVYPLDAETLAANHRAFKDIRALVPVGVPVTGDDRTLSMFHAHRLAVDYEKRADIPTEYHVYQYRFWNNTERSERQLRKLWSTGRYDLIYQQNGFYVLKAKHPPPLPAADVW